MISHASKCVYTTQQQYIDTRFTRLFYDLFVFMRFNDSLSSKSLQLTSYTYCSNVNTLTDSILDDSHHMRAEKESKHTSLRFRSVSIWIFWWMFQLGVLATRAVCCLDYAFSVHSFEMDAIFDVVAATDDQDLPHWLSDLECHERKVLMLRSALAVDSILDATQKNIWFDLIWFIIWLIFQSSSNTHFWIDFDNCCRS